MLYLEYDILNSFNISIDPIPLKPLSAHLALYITSIISLLYQTISNYRNEELKHEKEIKKQLSFNYFTDSFSFYDYTTYQDMIDNKDYIIEENDDPLEPLTEEQEKYITILKDLINPNSLNRTVILYYIERLLHIQKTHYFKTFSTTLELYYEQLENFGGIENFNLDMNMNPDIVLIINTPTENNCIVTCKSHLNFVDWIITDGIYEYVIHDKKYRYQLLSQMCEQGLLKGNMFVQFQLEEIPEIIHEIIQGSDDETKEEQDLLDTSISSNDNNSDDDETILNIEKLNHYYVYKQVKKNLINIYNKIIS